MQTNRLRDPADPLEAFDLEPGRLVRPASEDVTGQDHLVVPAHPGRVSLEDLVSLDITIEWDEAVAVVEELCSVVTPGDKESPIPVLGGILITAGGAVTLSAVGGEIGASAAGRTLHALLSSASVPVPLRLFVTQSTAPETYTSVREFAAGLAYFARPGRADLIRSLYQRAAARIAASSQAPPRETRKPASAPPRRDASSRTRLPAWAAPAFIAVAATLLLTLGIWLWSAGAPAAFPALPALVSQAKNVVHSLGTEVRESLGMGAQPRIENTERVDRPAPGTRSNRSAARRPVPISPAPAAALSGPPPAAPPVDEPTWEVVLTDILPTPAVIYSSTDANVRPPALLYPQLPVALITDPGLVALNTMEIVVSELGAVERVRLIAGPRRLPDIMLLSGAKAWHFTPAMKDDVPVRYLTVVSWSSVP